MAKLDSHEPGGPERRSSRRKNAVLEVAVVPVGEDLKQNDECFLAISKDISASGMSLIHTRAITSGSVVVELSNRDNHSLQLLACVIRCQAIHRFYEIGLRFITRLAGN
ncbi:MAG TPA: PilZ domain-containing protein [Pirellulales bacterium]|nr:PilZ domain-containing protein [Pirellulales bacterium]